MEERGLKCGSINDFKTSHGRRNSGDMAFFYDADTYPCVLEKWELQQWACVINRFMMDATPWDQECVKKIQPKHLLTLSSSVSRGNGSIPLHHSSGSLLPAGPHPTPSPLHSAATLHRQWRRWGRGGPWGVGPGWFLDYHVSSISSKAILSSTCMNGRKEKAIASPVPECKKRHDKVKGVN